MARWMRRVLAAVVALILLAVVSVFLPHSPTRRLAHDLRSVDCFRRPSSHHVVALGDSLTKMDSDAAWGFLGTDSWFSLAACQHRIAYGYNAGVYGDSTAGMLTRLDRDVAAYHPAEVVVVGGTNDLLLGVPLATTVGNLRAIVERSKALGAVVLLGTIPPIDWAQQRGEVAPLNQAITRLADTEHVTLVDFHRAVTQGDQYPAGWTTDGVHPTHLAAAAMERVFLQTATGR